MYVFASLSHEFSLLAFCLILSVYWYYIELELYSNSEIAE